MPKTIIIEGFIAGGKDDNFSAYHRSPNGQTSAIVKMVQSVSGTGGIPRTEIHENGIMIEVIAGLVSPVSAAVNGIMHAWMKQKSGRYFEVSVSDEGRRVVGRGYSAEELSPLIKRAEKMLDKPSTKGRSTRRKKRT